MSVCTERILQCSPFALLRLIESNLGRLLGHIDIFVECAVRTALLLLHRGAKLQKFFGNGLVGAFENVDETGKLRVSSQ